jgi:hypothetical protein
MDKENEIRKKKDRNLASRGRLRTSNPEGRGERRSLRERVSP